MNLEQILLVGSHVLTTVISLSVAVYIWQRRSEAQGSTCLAVLMAGISIWAFSEAIEFAVDSLTLKVWCSKASYIGANLIGPAWVFFALQFRGRTEWVTPGRIAVAGLIPAVMVLLVFTNEYHLWVWPRITPVVRDGYTLMKYDHGPVFWLNILCCYLFLLMGAVLVIQQALRLPKLYRNQSWILIIAAVIPWTTSAIYAMRLGPLPEVDLTPMAFAISGLLVTWNLFTLHLLDVAPIAHEVLFREIPDAVLVTDSQDRLVNLNSAAENWFGIHADAEVGKFISKVISNSPAILDRYHENTDGICVESKGNPSESRWIDVRVKQLTNRHQHKVGKILVLRDVTEQRQVEMALIDVERKLERSQKMESLGILAGGIAHDFNNLLLGMMGNIDLTLMDPSLPGTHRQNLDAALKASHRAAEICQQMLAFSGKGRFTIQPVDVNREAREVFQILKVSVPQHVELHCNLPETIPSIEADPSQIHQVIMNLAMNAIEAIGERNGIASLTTGSQFFNRDELVSPWIHQNLSEGAYVFIQVTDTGCGIPPENLPRIFDPFFSTKFIGRGLGLAAVLGIVRGHGGTLHVHSEERAGSTFRVLFPVSGSFPAA